MPSSQIQDDFEVVGALGAYQFIYTQGASPPPDLCMYIGTQCWSSKDGWPGYTSIYPGIRGEFAVRLFPFNISGDYIVGLTLLLQRTEEAFQKWQLATYNAIMDAYRSAKDEYDKKIAAQGVDRPSVQLKTDADYRAVESRELRRAALELLTDQHFDTFGAIVVNNNVPTLDNPTAISEGRIVEFFEHAFEWDQITYVFYPYFWGRKTEWTKKCNIAGADPVFSKFLSAGYARLVVPVRKGFENDIYYYLKTGLIWGGGSVPATGDPLYVSIIDEIKQMDAALERGNQDGLPEGSPWQIVVPTPLVCLDSDTVKLPNWDIVPAGKPPLFKPSEALCNGMPYNLAQWPDARSVATAMKALGFGVADMQDYDSYFRSGEGRRFVQAFQRRANELGVATVLGGRLRVDGIIGPCTLRGLTVMMDKLARGQWPGAGTT